MSNILSISGLSKRYSSVLALSDVSFEVEKNSVFGLLGPNGSGKTTLLGIILNVINADSGNYQWFDGSHGNNTRKKIGTLLETPNFYHYLSATDNLAVSQSIHQRGTKADIPEVLEAVNLHNTGSLRFSSFSLGMKQRLAIANTLLGKPDVLVLDEPTNGLDAAGIIEIRELIKNIAQNGRTVIMASHNLDEVEKVCTNLVILKKGKLLIKGAVKDVLSDEDIVELGFEGQFFLPGSISNLPGYIKYHQEEKVVQLTFKKGTAHIGNINRLCFENGITLTQMQIKQKSLEERYIEITK